MDAFLRRFAKGVDRTQLTPIPTGPYGSSFVFYYGTDRILKVNKVGSRQELLKEAGLQAHLSQQDLPVQVPAPLQVHPRGFYAIYPRLAGQSLTAAAVAAFSTAEMDAFTRAIGAFLTCLHEQDLPVDLARLVLRGERDMEGMLERASTSIDFIDAHAPGEKADALRARLDGFRGTLPQRWVTNHGDLSLSNIMRLEGEQPAFAVIDFNDAETCDPSMEFEIFADDLDDEAVDAGQILSAVLHHYNSHGDDVQHKLSFRRLLGQIHDEFRRVRAGVPPSPIRA